VPAPPVVAIEGKIYQLSPACPATDDLFITSKSQAVHRGPRDLGPAWRWAKRFSVVRSDPGCG